jgi:hypothetical protein
MAQSNLDDGIPQVTLVVLGAQGVGKSTFIQNSFDLRSPSPSAFAVQKMSLDDVVYLVREQSDKLAKVSERHQGTACRRCSCSLRRNKSTEHHRNPGPAALVSPQQKPLPSLPFRPLYSASYPPSSCKVPPAESSTPYVSCLLMLPNITPLISDIHRCITRI